MKTTTGWILRRDRLPSILTVGSIATVVLIAAVWLSARIPGAVTKVQAQDRVCSVASLQGAYAFRRTGVNNGAGGASARPVGNQSHTRYTMTDIGMLGALFIGAPTINTTALTGRSARDDDEPPQINFVQGKIAFEFAGQVTNFAPTPEAPLGSSNQYGYLTTVRGIDNPFSGSPHNEATAVLTFFNEATTTGSFSDGPLRINDREGITTIYLNSVPASFANPDSFRSGIPVQTSTLHQQAIVDPVAGSFTAVFANNISSTSTFTINGTTLTLGQKGQAFRATVTGHVNAPPPPNGQFAGYAVGVGEE